MYFKARRWFLFGLLVVFGLALPVASARAQDDLVELVGTIEAVNGTTITVNGLTIDVSSAEVSAPLEVGTNVKIEGTLLADGTIQATEVKLAESGILPDEIELVGTLDEIGAGFVVVSGLTFDTTSAEVESGLAVGDLVKVHASLSADGTWIAREVGSAVVDNTDNGSSDDSSDDSADDSGDDSPDDSSDDSANEIELTATLEEVGSGYIVVAGLTFDTTQAEIKGTLVVGALVKVHAVQASDGSWMATEVETSSLGDSAGGSSDACVFEVEVSSANLRSGPGTDYPVVGTASEGERLAASAISTDGAWVQVAADTWIAMSVGQLDEDCSGLSTSDMPVMGGSDSSGDDSGDDSSDDSMDDDSSDDSGDDSSDDSGDDSMDDDSSDDSGDDSGDDSSDD